MKYTKPLFFLLIITAITAHKAEAQTGRDTLFTFYFNTNQHTTNNQQQKSFERFLQKVARIKTITGYTDTTGTWEHNEVLSLWRALDVMNQLPKALQPGVEVLANSETKSAKQLWQNRRAEVVGIVKDKPEQDSTIETTFITETTATTLNSPDSIITELTIDQVFFVPDLPEIREASWEYIPILAKKLLQYKNAHFQIVGHVNYQSNLPPERLKDLYDLSEQRAKAVYDLLIENGIEAARLSYKGVGNSQPLIAQPANDAERQKNMRVQVLIIRD